MRVVAACLSQTTITQTCELFGISRKTSYNWLERYAAGGAAVLAEPSQRAMPTFPPELNYPREPAAS